MAAARWTYVIPMAGPKNHKKNKRFFWRKVFSFLSVISQLQFALCVSVLACPMCSELMERGRDAFKMMRFGQGIAWSILLMLLMPLVLIGSIAFLIVQAHRNARNKTKD